MSSQTIAPLQDPVETQSVKKSIGYGSDKKNQTAMSGEWLHKVRFYNKKSSHGKMTLIGMDMTFGSLEEKDNGQPKLSTVTLGTKDDHESGGKSPTLTLGRDSISVMYVLYDGHNNGVIYAIHLETVSGQTFDSNSDYKYKDTSDKRWHLVEDNRGEEPLKNWVWLGCEAGHNDTGISYIRFLYKNDVRISQVVTNVEYSDAETGAGDPSEIATASVSNHTSETQEMELTLTESISASVNFGFSISTMLGLEVGFEAGIPFVEQGEVKVTAQVTTSISAGGSVTAGRTYAYNAKVTVPPMTGINATANAQRQNISGSFTADLIDRWVHAGRITRPVSGTFNGVSAYEVKVSYQEFAWESAA